MHAPALVDAAPFEGVWGFRAKAIRPTLRERLPEDSRRADRIEDDASAERC